MFLFNDENITCEWVVFFNISTNLYSYLQLIKLIIINKDKMKT